MSTLVSANKVIAVKYQFSILRLLLAVPIFAVPFALLRGYETVGAVLAGIIGASLAGAFLLGRRVAIVWFLMFVLYTAVYFILVGIVSTFIDSSLVELSLLFIYIFLSTLLIATMKKLTHRFARRAEVEAD